MGESKRRRESQERAASNLTKELTDNGKLIEAGFAIFADVVIPKDAPPVQLVETQLAFMAGAEHVWSSVLNMLDPDDEPTADDIRRMDLIQRELDEWRGKLSERVNRREQYYSQQPHQRLGDAPVEAEYHDKMTAVTKGLDHFFNGEAKGDERKIGFVLMVFPFGEEVEGRCNYMSNGADRRDVVTLFKEMIARFEGQPDVSGRA